MEEIASERLCVDCHAPLTPESAKAEIAALRRAVSRGHWNSVRAHRFDELKRAISEQEFIAERRGRIDLVDKWNECRFHWESLYAMTLVSPPLPR